MKNPKNFNTAEMPIFIRDYFIQTRAEIDTEKRERDRLLHFAIILLGGVMVVLLRREGFVDFGASVEGIALGVSLLTILTSLFWIRWKKLCQIADRWYVLHHLLEDYLTGKQAKFFLEEIVIEGFKNKRYVRKDLVLNFALCLPIYFMIVRWAVNFLEAQNVVEVIVLVGVLVVHLILCFFLLGRQIKKPLNLVDAGV